MRVALTPCGVVVQVDGRDLALLSEWRWSRQSAGYDEGRRGGRLRAERVLLHRLIMRAQPGELIDHRNGDKLDNRRSNLRLADKSTNGANRHARTSSTGLKGVVRQGSRFRAQIKVHGVNHYLGSFGSAEAAARAYDVAAVAAFGEFADVNLPCGH